MIDSLLAPRPKPALSAPDGPLAAPRTPEAAPELFWSRFEAALWTAPRTVAREVVALFDAISASYMELLLLKDGRLGLLFMAGTFLRPQVGCGGVLAVIAAYTFYRFLGHPAPAPLAGVSYSNPLLAGLALGAVLAPSWEAAALVAVLGIVTFLVRAALAHVFQVYLKLPVLTLPAVLCTMIASAAVWRYSNLAIGAGGPATDAWSWLPFPVAGFLRALGAILFVPHPAVGLFFAGLLAWRSRILLLLAVAGYVAAVTFRGAMTGAPSEAVLFPYNYNFPLVAMLLGGVLFVPSWKSYAVALLGAVTAAVLLDAAAACWPHGPSPLFLPFNVVSLAFLYGLSVLGFTATPRLLGETPEETLQIDLAFRYRSPETWRTLQLPFYGRWNVWQGCDGPWTHQGPCRHAYDFVIQDEEGRTFAGTGLALSDYHCFRRPVLSPVRGVVALVVATLPDNEPGSVDGARHWGNVVSIYDDRGFYVLLAHFAEASIKVSVGERVEPGTVLGLVGNSGFSPQPHLHIQVQATPEVGAASIPFRIVRYRVLDRFEPDERLAAGSSVEPLPIDTSFDQRFEFLLGEELVYDVFDGPRRTGELRLTVRIAVDGTLYFQSQRGGRLYFGKSEGTFWFYRAEGPDPHLSLLLRALPRVPMCYRDGLRWSDALPASVLTRGPARAALQLASAFWRGAERTRCELAFERRDRVRGRTRSTWWPLAEEAVATFDEAKGPASVTLGRFRLQRATTRTN